jgi:hypothetical protein
LHPGPTYPPVNTELRVGPQRLPQPDKYSGANDTRRVEDFLEEAELWMVTSGIPVTHLATWGSFMLNADAKLFLTSKLDDLRVRTGVRLPAMAWQQFCEIMIEGYCKPELNVSARGALHALQQNKSSVPDLAR